jgi:transposase
MCQKCDLFQAFLDASQVDLLQVGERDTRFLHTSREDGHENDSRSEACLWASYFLYDCEHALCLVHLLRELVFQAEQQGAVWAAELKDLLLSMKQATQQARAQGKHWLDPLEVLDWELAFLRLLDEGDQVTPRATAPPGTKGRIKQSAARNLLDRVRKHQKAVFCFLEDLRVDFDNNLAERDLRMLKVQQKVSGCFRSLAGAQAFSRIRGYLSTLRKQGLPLLPALQATLCGHPLLPSFE